MTRLLLLSLVTIVLVLAASDPADARRSRGSGNSLCFSTTAGHDELITGCTEYLSRGDISQVNRSSAHYNRGNSYYKKDDYDSAIADYDEAIRLNPNVVKYYNNRGNAYFGKRDYDRAIRDLSTAIRLDPGFTGAYTNRGRVYEVKGDIERARADYLAALAVPPKFDNGKWAHETARLRLTELNSGGLPTGGKIRDSGRLQSDLGSPPPGPAAEPPAWSAPAPVAAPSPTAPSPAAPSQPIGRRVALVIGNSAYTAVPELPNARSDAQAVATTLRDLGFQKVAVETDTARERLLNALRAFAIDADSADWATIYYAGHGVEMNGINYLIPIDAKLAVDRDLEFEAVGLDRLISAVDGAKKLRLVMLDACRDNPFLTQMRRSATTRSIGRGLAQVEPEAGTLVVYAAKHGQVALDGDGRNSPFVSALIGRIKTPGLEVRRLFDLVRDDVMVATRRRQQPFSYGSISGSEDFFFAPR